MSDPTSTKDTAVYVLSHRDGAVGYLILNRPEKKNALDISMRHAIAESMRVLNEDPEVVCIVVTGGDEVFAAGADLNMLVEKDSQGVRELDLAGYWEQFADSPKPVIAAVSGYALGAGCELAMMADIVIADSTAKFGQPESSIGIMPGAGGTQRLIRAVGKPLASLMLYAGEIIDADRALQAGLVSERVAQGEAMARAEKLARRICQMPPLALAAIKRTLSQGADIPLQDALRQEREEFFALFDTDDQTEGMRAFLEKRKPAYSGS